MAGAEAVVSAVARDADDRLRRAAAAMAEMREQIDALERRALEPIAIVGMACRFPGGANTPQRFWEILRDGAETLGPVPADRWNAAAYYDPDPDAHWKTDIRESHFIDQSIDAFEPEFFGISPREALSLDPQQRLLLEVSWEALENAAIPPDRLRRSDTGVYIGTISSDYGRIPFTDVNPADLPYFGTGNGSSFEAGRISYVLGLHGPSMLVATACSSTLTTTHLAAQALRTGECDLALSGGVSLMLYPDTSIILSQMRATASDGRSKTFDRGADGFGRGEGCGVLVLKRLSDALRDGDAISALVRGSAVNHDGATSGITVPSGPAQERVLRRALAAGGHDPDEVDLIEAHGTGTALGDPIELIALGSLFSHSGRRRRPVLVGSVKTNIGHLEAAAGAAGLIKLALALQHEQIPPHRNLAELTDKVDWEELSLRVPTELAPWPRGERPRVAGVSGFGLSGINAHVVVSEAPARVLDQAAPREPDVLVLSARTEAALDQLRELYAGMLETPDGPAVPDVCATAAGGRTLMARRMTVVAGSRAAMIQGLRRGESQDGAFVARGEATAPRRLAFLFTGQGSQRIGMGRDLYESEPVFRATLDHCQEVLAGVLEQPLLAVMFSDDPRDGRLHQTLYTQPALFALELALARQWEAWGVRPDVVIGHSIGEYAAACVAGILAPDDALLLVSERARRMQAVTESGAMTMIAAGEEEVREALSGHHDTVSIAAVNGPRHVVLSGAREDVAAITAAFARRGIRTRELKVSHAFHSPQMSAVAEAFAGPASQVRYSPAQLPIIGNLTGRADDAMASAEYWPAQIRETVRFHAGLETIAQDGAELFLELGPEPVLSAIGQDFVSGGRWLASLSAKTPDRAQMLQSLATLVADGGPGDLERLYPRRAYHLVALPNYPFQRKRYWIPLKGDEHPPVRPSHLPALAGTDHPLLGRRLHVAGSSAIFESHLGPKAPGYLSDHRIHGNAVLPAAAYLEMALAAARRLFDDPAALSLRDVTLKRPLFLSDERYVTVQLLAHRERPDVLAWEVHSLADGRWQLHAQGQVHAAGADKAAAHEQLSALRARCPQPASLAAFYELVASRGLEYGPSFRALRSLSSGDSFSLGEVELDSGLGGQEGYELHPVLLDACLQALGAMFPYQDDADVFLPAGLEALNLRCRPGVRHWVRAWLRDEEGPGRGGSADFDILDQAGELVAEIRALRFARAPRAALVPAGSESWRGWLFELGFSPLPGPADPDPATPTPSCLVLGDDSQLANDLTEELRAAGCQVLPVGRPSAWEAVLAELIPGPSAIVYLAPAAGWREGAGGLLALVQSLAASPLPALPRLTVVTVDAISVAGEPAPGWEQLTAVGLARVVAREHPELGSRILDVGSEDGLAAQSVAREVLGGALEPEVVLRAGARWAPRLRPARPAPLTGAPIRADGSYLVAGGLGGIGLQTAAHLVALGAGRVVLAGRTPPSPPLAARLHALSGRGTRVEFVAVDLADPSGVAELVRSADSAAHPLRGVFNLAASFDDGILLNQDLERFARVLGPKVEGSWNLHICTQALALDHFVLFGSAAALFGNPGQASYAAANAYLGGLAGYRRALGLPCTTIDWGGWEDIGATSRERLDGRLAQRAAQGIGVSEGMAVLDHVLGRAGERIAVLALDRGIPVELARDPLLSELAASDHGRTTCSAALAQELLDTPGPQRRTLAIERLSAVVGSVLGMDAGAGLDPEAGFFDLGLDSMMALEVRNQLAGALGVPLPASVALDHPTAGRLADHLLELLFGSANAGADGEPAIASELTELLEDIEGLSDEDVGTRILQ